MTSLQCWCGMPFACPTDLYEAAKDGRNPNHPLHCPIGHSINFKTRVQELERQVAGLQQDLNAQKRATEFAKNETAAERRKTKRLQKRAQAGVCTQCNRTFQNVARHMATKHQP